MLITADKIHDGKKFLHSGAALELTDDGAVVAVHENYKGEAQHYEGTVCPGFVNAHCHLELSHLKGLIPKHTGLIPFLLHVIKGRNSFTEEEKKAARMQAYETLWQHGVSAVGDIANTADSLDVRALEKLHVHTFAEAIGFDEAIAEKSFEFALKTYKAFNQQTTKSQNNKQSITPHAPYSVSQRLFGLINDFEKQSVISIHNQETEEEDKFYKDKSGGVNELLRDLGIEALAFQPSGLSSLQTYTQWINNTHPMIFVHNSFSKTEDVRFAVQRFQNAFFCLCPNANLYIENTLPDVKMLMEAGAALCIGTDSLASNEKLCVYSELQTLHQHFGTDWELLLQWACYNGAKALQMDNTTGHFAAGMKPGVVHITHDNPVRII